MKLNLANINFEPEEENIVNGLDLNNINFEPSEEELSQSNVIDFQSGEPVSLDNLVPKRVSTKGEIKPIRESLVSTVKAMFKVTGVIAGSLAATPGAGVEAITKLLPRIQTDPDKPWYKFKSGSLTEAQQILDKRLGAFSSLITTPEEVKALEYISYAMKPIEMSGEGLRLIASGVNDLLKSENMSPEEDPIPILEPFFQSIGEISAIYGSIKLPKIINDLLGSPSWRLGDIPKNRSLMIQDLQTTLKNNPNITEGELLRKYSNPQWREEAL